MKINGTIYFFMAADTIFNLLTKACESTLKGTVTNFTDIADINTFDSNL